MKTVTGYQSCVVGWNTLNVKDGENDLATIGYDETEAALKVDIAAGGAWYKKALVYRTPDNAGSLGKYKLTFKVKSTNAKDMMVRVMRGRLRASSQIMLTSAQVRVVSVVRLFLLKLQISTSLKL